jgi:hypothetical protein
LLQAVRELALRDKDDTERRLVEALATQLKMGKRTIEGMPVLEKIEAEKRETV